MFYLFYNLIFFAFFVPVAIIYLIISLIKGKPVNSFSKRFFYGGKGKDKIDIHFHGVSVGEILSIEKLTKEISGKLKYSVSVGTEAGYKTALKKYKTAEKTMFSPFDFPFSVKSFVESVNPKIFIIVEAEFWYNLYYYIRKRDIPIWIINFRVGNKKAYLKLKFYYKRVFKFVDKFFVPSKDYSDFLKKFDVPEDKIILSNNLKADISYNKIDEQQKSAIKRRLRLKNNKKIFIAGSISLEEWKKIVKILKRYKQNWRFIVAPRHIEKSKEIKEISEKESLKTEFITEIINDDYDVVIVNTIGELFGIYSIGDLAFVGGSLIPNGGHNILEPVFHSVPTLTGHYYFNFKELVESLKKQEGIIIIDAAEELSNYLDMEKKELINIGKNGKRALNNMGGAVEIILKELKKAGIEC